MKLYAVINSEKRVRTSGCRLLIFTHLMNAEAHVRKECGESVIPIEATFTRIVEQKVELEVEG
jgi:hypothetical protein